MNILNRHTQYRRSKHGCILRMYNGMKHRVKHDPRYKDKVFSIHKEEFEKWVKENYSAYIKIYKYWEENGFKIKDSPSIDRIDNSKGYTLDNIQILRFGDNVIKEHLGSVNPSRWKRVKQIKDNKVIKKYRAISHAVKETGISATAISNCLSGRSSHAGGYQWTTY